MVTSSNATYWSVVAVMPGVSQDGDLTDDQAVVNGSRFTESSVFIDGVDTTYARRGGSRMWLPDVSTTEVSMQSAGSSAEFGRAVGSTTSVITKSGTNVFHGEASFLHQEGNWVSEYSEHPELLGRESCLEAFARNDPADLANRPNCTADFFVRSPEEKDLSTDTVQSALGGPIAKDKAWFFLSFGQIDSFTARKTFAGDLVRLSAEIDSKMVKLNFQPAPSHSLNASYIGTPMRLPFLLGTLPADKYGATIHDFGGDLVNLTWNWSQSSKLFLETKIAAQASDEDKYLNAGDGLSLDSAIAEKQQDPRYPGNPAAGQAWPGNNFSAYFDGLGEDHQWNGWWLDNGFGTNEYPRDQFNTKLTWFAKEHDVMFGLDWQETQWDQDLQHNDTYTGPIFDAFSATGFESCSLIFGNVCTYFDVSPPEFEGQSPIAGSSSENVAFFVRDRFSAGDHWAFNLGFRVEDQSHTNDVGRTVIDSTDVAPRLQVTYDVHGDGKMLASVNVGRTYQHLGLDITNSFLLEGWNGVNAYDQFVACEGFDRFFLPFCAFYGDGYTVPIARLRPGTMWQQVDAGIFDVDIDPYYKDEIVLGFEWSVTRNWLLDVKGIYYELGNPIGSTEQILPNGDIFLLTENYKDYPKVLGSLGVVDPQVLANFEEGVREYEAIQLQFNRRYRNNWALYNNITIQDATGHYHGGLFDDTTASYGESLQATLQPFHIDECQALQDGVPPTLTNPFNQPRTHPVDCAAALGPHLGQPLSTINRYGSLPEVHDVVIKSFGFKNWFLGGSDKHILSIGGFFAWESGKPWERTESLEFALGCDIDGFLCTPEQNTFDNDVTVYLQERGSQSAFNEVWDLDLFGTWTFPIQNRLTGNIRLEVNNLFDEQKLQRISGRGEVGTSREISYQNPREFRMLVGFGF